MCGIWAYIVGKRYYDAERVRNAVDTLSARGPESLAIKHIRDVVLGFCRLAINDVSPSGMQPMSHANLHWICNGEIYNWKELRNRLGLSCSSASDCSIIGPLWDHFKGDASQFFRSLDGVFSLIIYDENKEQLIIGRDPYGVRPLFRATDSSGRTCFGSEMKSLVELCNNIESFPPGHYSIYKANLDLQLTSQRYHTVPWVKNQMWSPAYEGGLQLACEAVRESLRLAVRKRLMTERPIAALLSGGVDSSLICALLQSELKRANGPTLKTFSIGFEGSPDLFHARLVANHIGSEHTEVVVTPQDFIDAIPDVIAAIESYDTTTVRASIGNWLVAREIRRRTECKVVFNGDGSDEIFGSYLYFFRAPCDEAFETETMRLLEDIHCYDVLRSDRSISAHGLEPRTPFLDKQFVAVARAVSTQWRRPILSPSGNSADDKTSLSSNGYPIIEKWILRKAFDGTNILPNEVLWRQKEAFSDGVSNRSHAPWYSSVKCPVDDSVSSITYLPPKTPEARYYRKVFDDNYGGKCYTTIKYFWMPKWSGETSDPSARTLSLYSSSGGGEPTTV